MNSVRATVLLHVAILTSPYVVVTNKYKFSLQGGIQQLLYSCMVILKIERLSLFRMFSKWAMTPLILLVAVYNCRYCCVKLKCNVWREWKEENKRRRRKRDMR